MEKEQKKYSFTVPGVYKGLSAEVAAKELERIRVQYGSLEPEYVVKESVDPNSVLHNVFEWDETKAAEGFRREQARLLIKSIRVEIIQNKVSCSMRAYVNVRESKDAVRNYIPIEKAILNDDAYEDLLQQSKDEMESFVSKYAQVTELNNVKQEMLKAISEIKPKKK